jgi:uncharacterized protein YjbI with pentapeptide repeats
MPTYWECQLIWGKLVGADLSYANLLRAQIELMPALLGVNMYYPASLLAANLSGAVCWELICWRCELDGGSSLKPNR